MHFQFNKNNVQNVFNLGLHLNNTGHNIVKENIVNYLRKGHNFYVQNPKFFFVQMIYLVRFISHILQNKGKIMVINTGSPYFGRYKYWFEGLDIVCWEDPWLFGNLSNPRFGLERPDLIILLSASKADLSFILDEINVLSIPLINLSKKSTGLDLIRINVENNSVCVQFIMHIVYIVIQNFYKRDIDSSLNNEMASPKDRNDAFTDENVVDSFYTFYGNKAKYKVITIRKK